MEQSGDTAGNCTEGLGREGKGSKGCSRKWQGQREQGVFIRVLSHQAMGLLSIGRLPVRLSIILLPRSVDVVEERHGERHAQELWGKRRRRRRTSEFVYVQCVHTVHACVCVCVWLCMIHECLAFLMLMPWAAVRFWCATNPAVKHKHISSDGLQTRALESLWWENVRRAQALSQWSKLRCHWIKVASYRFEVSITPDTSTSNTVARLILKPLSGEVLMAAKTAKHDA